MKNLIMTNARHFSLPRGDKQIKNENLSILTDGII